jgi:hypothetical protein
LVVTSLAAFLLLSRPGRRAASLWLPVIAVLGPLGLLVRRLATGGAGGEGPDPGERAIRRRRALVETAAGVAPAVVGIVLAFLIIVRVPAVGDSSLRQLLVDWGLPLGLGLIFSQVPLLAGAGGAHAGRRLPWAFVSANLAVAGLLAVALPLVPLQMKLCPIDALTPLSWWAIVALGAPVGGLPLYGYWLWAVRRGLGSWSALFPGASERVADPSAATLSSGRRLGLWLMVSVAALVTGIALGAMLTGVLVAPG